MDRVVAPLGLTHAQFSLLGALSGLTRGSGRRPSQRELADHTGMEPIYVSKLARALEKAGLVERPPDPDDPRAVRVTLTERGHEVIERAVALVDTLQSELLDPVGGEDSERHREFRETLLALLGETHTESEPTMTTSRVFGGHDINAAAAATRAVLDRLLAEAGLSFDEWTALRATARQEGTSEPRLSPDMVFMDRASSRIEASVNLRQLEGSGLVQFTGDQVNVTTEGRELFERVTEASERANNTLLEGISPSDLEAAKRVLDRISERAGRVRVEL
ncbi:MarR family winged helix-turn-helix transcriptional regulator [Amycolatopsis acididurans]|uniref:MarR family winged helix-turn-helix transcriptional regulator n=1 Tax=Amycolatopsis acididurans TaxID=2724524 RepID=UPI0028A663AB|nr:MarR family transcriptional regulator [Amycolatopsis acididurans]